MNTKQFENNKKCAQEPFLSHTALINAHKPNIYVTQHSSIDISQSHCNHQ